MCIAPVIRHPLGLRSSTWTWPVPGDDFGAAGTVPLTQLELGALSGMKTFPSPPLLEEQQDSEQIHFLQSSSEPSVWFGSS